MEITMNITDVRVRLINKDDSKLKAVASITIDNCFVVHEIRVLEGTDGNFIKMPSRKIPEGGYKDVAHPLNTETRNEIAEKVLAAYEKEKANPTNND